MDKAHLTLLDAEVVVVVAVEKASDEDPVRGVLGLVASLNALLPALFLLLRLLPPAADVSIGVFSSMSDETEPSFLTKGNRRSLGTRL